MFRASELRTFLDREELELLWLSASSAIATGLDSALLPDERSWPFLVDIEEMACTETTYLDGGTHLIVAVRLRSAAATA